MSLSAGAAIADGTIFSNRVARNQKVFLGLCVCALLLNYLDRASISIAASECQSRSEPLGDANRRSTLSIFHKLRHRLASGRLSHRPVWRSLLVKRCNFSLVARTRGRRSCGALPATSPDEIHSRHHRGADRPVQRAGGRELVPQGSPWPPDRHLRLRYADRPGPRAAAPDRPDALAGVARHVHHDGRGWGRIGDRLLGDLPRRREGQSIAGRTQKSWPARRRVACHGAQLVAAVPL